MFRAFANDATRQAGAADGRRAVRRHVFFAAPRRMTTDPIPQAVLALLRERVTSFEHLEVLMLLHAHPHEDWTVVAVSERTRIAAELAGQVLQELESNDLIRRTTRNHTLFRFGPRLPESMDAVEALARLYREQRALVMSTMSVQAIERIRSATMRAFADSFVLKRRNDDG